MAAAEDRNSWDPPPFFVEEFQEVKKTASAAQGAVSELKARVGKIEEVVENIPGGFKRLESEISEVKGSLFDVRAGQRALMEAVMRNNEHDIANVRDVGVLRAQIAEHTTAELSRRSTGLHAFSGIVATVATLIVSAAWLILQMVAQYSGLTLSP